MGILIRATSENDNLCICIIPLGAVMYATAGRHPLLGITTAFAGVSGGFSANFLPSSLDPLLQGFTQKAAHIIDPNLSVNPLCNWGFMSASCIFIRQRVCFCAIWECMSIRISYYGKSAATAAWR